MLFLRILQMYLLELVAFYPPTYVLPAYLCLINHKFVGNNYISKCSVKCEYN